MQKRENKEKTMVVKIIGNGIIDDPYRVDLPTYTIIKELNRHKDGTFPPGGGRVMVSVPDYCCDNNGKLDKNKIRKTYRGSKWDRPDVGDDVERSDQVDDKGD